MSQRIAVAVVHGIGVQSPSFAEPIITELTDRLAHQIPSAAGEPEEQVIMAPVHWAPVLQRRQDWLWQRVSQAGDLDLPSLRRFLIDFASDAIAYQHGSSGQDVYEEVHACLAGALRGLARKAGPTAPLCIIAHSLGSVLVSNYVYDLQNGKPLGQAVRAAMSPEPTPLERGQTLTLLYTLGSPLALWSLRYDSFGSPIRVPSPDLHAHHFGLQGKWVNYFDADDVLAYPLKRLNDAYDDAVELDEEVNIGGPLSSWNPACHMHYWTDDDITVPITYDLADLWKAVNP